MTPAPGAGVRPFPAHGGNLEVQAILEERLELDAQQPALGQHAPLLLDQVAEIRLQLRVHQHHGLAEERPHLGAANIEYIRMSRNKGQVQIAARRSQAVAQPRAVQKQIQSMELADLVESGQLLFV